MYLYNARSMKIEEFKCSGTVKMYTCGPTVYHFAHIGNLRTYIMEDVLEKTLHYIGYDVDRVMNITDVGHLSSDADTGLDKMVKGAKREHTTVQDIAKRYTDIFKEDCRKLNIKWPKKVVKATDCISDYISFIQKLIEKDYAYFKGGNVYFDTSKLEEYYTLTNHTKEDLKEAVREDVEIDSNKKNKNDFVLWFTKSKFDDQELKWESPWGLGYPGWHIECSVIAIKYLGEYLDIHCGGVDNIFPHHTNEIAQSEAYLGHKWCRYWFHSEHLNDQTGKMSKSKGDFLTVSLLESKGYNPLTYRLFVLQSHYRKPLTFSFESLAACQNQYNKLKSKISNIKENKEDHIDEDKVQLFDKRFKAALKNDLNTANALTVLYDVLKDNLNGKTKIYLISQFDSVLGLDLLKKDKIDEEFEKYIKSQIEKRNEYKKNKDYKLSDMIRDELLSKGVIIKDTKEGTIYEIR